MNRTVISLSFSLSNVLSLQRSTFSLSNVQRSLYPTFSLSTGVYVPVGGKKLLTYLDDLNMPAKDEYGSQPPLELMRQWIDYGSWYDRLKQTVKEIRVRCTPTHTHTCNQ